MSLQRIHFSSVASTNDVAKELLHASNEAVGHIIVVTAAEQTSGRGRNGKIWHGIQGESVFCSIGLMHKPASRERTMQELVMLQAIGCLAAQTTCEELARGVQATFPKPLDLDNIQFCLKYPNDVYALRRNTARKICGTLVEHEFLGTRCIASVIGIGLNVRQTAFPDNLIHKATSLLMLGIDASTEVVTQTLLHHAEQLLHQPAEVVLAAWRQKLNIEDTFVHVDGAPGWWKVVSLLNDGRLLLVQPTTSEERIVSDGDTIVIDWMRDDDHDDIVGGVENTEGKRR
jgi:biotin-[acetyl-CoA-carboxylase] ligase BirA-like protein